MNFKEATDGLFDRIDHAELAEALGVSVASIRQARLSGKALAYRNPPEGWEAAVVKLAKARITRLGNLIETLTPKRP